MGNFVMHQDKLALLTPKRLVIHHTLLPVHQNNEKNDNTREAVFTKTCAMNEFQRAL
jgi:hypothetical protein